MVALASAVAFATVGYGLSAPIRIRGARCRAHRRRTHIFHRPSSASKLLPTTVLHHRHLGELMIALLLFSRSAGDHCLGGDGKPWRASELTDLAKHFPGRYSPCPYSPSSAGSSVRFVLFNLIKRFDRYHEIYLFCCRLDGVWAWRNWRSGWVYQQKLAPLSPASVSPAALLLNISPSALSLCETSFWLCSFSRLVAVLMWPPYPQVIPTRHRHGHGALAAKTCRVPCVGARRM